METLQLERLVDDPEIRRAAAKTLKGFCLTYLPHHFPADLSDFFDEMGGALQDHSNTRLEIIGWWLSPTKILARIHPPLAMPAAQVDCGIGGTAAAWAWLVQNILLDS
jgi:hypothetical protein